MIDGEQHKSAEEVERRERMRRELAAKYCGVKESPARPVRRVAHLWVLLLCVFVYGFFLETSESMPDNAWVYAGGDAGLYYAPPYLRDTGRDVYGLVLLTAAEAKSMNYRPDPTAKAQGYFRQEGRSLSGEMLAKLGLLAPAKSRWNRDGTWNW